jgi:alpha-1,3-rhamnosyltransferase
MKLVSVSVITYNSSEYVLDTLESVKAQTYPCLELVISDDCSTDNTVDICREWIVKNKERFVDTKIIVAKKNQGISANYNQGMDNCTGDFIKEIAGDDMLLPNCVEDYVRFASENPDAFFCFGRAIIFDGDDERRREYGKLFHYEYFKLPSSEQYKILMENGNFICSATFFYNRKKMVELGIRNDERIPMMEDWPKWINILSRGYKLSFLDKNVVKYRMSNNGLSSQHEKPILWQRQFALLELLYRQPYAEKMHFSKRKTWRKKQYAKQLLEKKWYRTILLFGYETLAKLFRILDK